MIRAAGYWVWHRAFWLTWTKLGNIVLSNLGKFRNFSIQNLHFRKTTIDNHFARIEERPSNCWQPNLSTAG